MKRNNVILLIIVLLTLVSLIAFSTYAYFANTANPIGMANLNVISETNNMVFDTLGGGLILNVTSVNMTQANNNTVASENNTTLTVNFQANTNYDMVCSYDIVYEWTSSDKYQAHTSGVSQNEFTIQASLASNNHVSEGDNYIHNETDFTGVVGNQNSATVVSGAQIDGTGSTINTAVWTITGKFYNVNANQNALSDKKYQGNFKIANVSCVAGVVQSSQTLANYIVNNAPKSGTDAATSSPWILTSDHAGEWRYAGRNPDNFIEFNGELWRIIGVMPNTEYCTGEYGSANECSTTSTGRLVKIIRDRGIGFIYWDDKGSGVGSSTIKHGSSDWSDSQIMLMMNGSNYLTTAYDINGTQLHTSYTITNGMIAGNGYNFYNATYSYLDGNGTTLYKPSSATTSSYSPYSLTVQKKIDSTSLPKIATAKWDLYTIGAGNMTPVNFYNSERNINNTGAVYTSEQLIENRPVYWYGKIGLMYPSDYGYATGGGMIYDRNTCLESIMSEWDTEDYQTDCAYTSYLLYSKTGSVAPGIDEATQQWSISGSATSLSRYVYALASDGDIFPWDSSQNCSIRPVLYLKADTLYSGNGTGTWDDPYIIE